MSKSGQDQSHLRGRGREECPVVHVDTNDSAIGSSIDVLAVVRRNADIRDRPVNSFDSPTGSALRAARKHHHVICGQSDREVKLARGRLVVSEDSVVVKTGNVQTVQ